MSSVVATDLAPAGEGSTLPSENISFVFNAITEVTLGGFTSWDFARATATGPAPALPVHLAQLPASDTTLSLQLSGGSAPAATLDLESFNFALHSKLLDDSSPSSQKVAAFDSLDVITRFSEDSRKILAALARGQFYQNALLVQSDSQGNHLAAWAFANVFVNAQSLDRDSDGNLTETISFAYAALSQGIGTRVSGWNQVSNSDANIPDVPDPAPPTDDLTGLRCN